jgi:hypothetical protein
MYCSGCGHALQIGQALCPQCSRPVAPITPVPLPLQFELERYAGKIRVLGILWLIYAGLSLVLGFAGLAFVHSFFSHGFGPWANGPTPQMWFFPALLRFAWVFLVGRAALAIVAGWGLLERTDWGKIVAIVAAVLSLLKFPFGTALAIATLVILLGYRNSALYDQL